MKSDAPKASGGRSGAAPTTHLEDKGDYGIVSGSVRHFVHKSSYAKWLRGVLTKPRWDSCRTALEQLQVAEAQFQRACEHSKAALLRFTGEVVLHEDITVLPAGLTDTCGELLRLNDVLLQTEGILGPHLGRCKAIDTAVTKLSHRAIQQFRKARDAGNAALSIQRCLATLRISREAIRLLEVGMQNIDVEGLAASIRSVEVLKERFNQGLTGIKVSFGCTMLCPHSLHTLPPPLPPVQNMNELFQTLSEEGTDGGQVLSRLIRNQQESKESMSRVWQTLAKKADLENTEAVLDKLSKRLTATFKLAQASTKLLQSEQMISRMESVESAVKERVKISQFRKLLQEVSLCATPR